MKTKNPLYVVKGKDVQEANSVIDLVIKKLNLEPAMNILKNIFLLLLEQVENFAMFQTVKKFIDDMIKRVRDLRSKLGAITT